jgi:hypothetical protein
MTVAPRPVVNVMAFAHGHAVGQFHVLVVLVRVTEAVPSAPLLASRTISLNAAEVHRSDGIVAGEVEHSRDRPSPARRLVAPPG